MATSAPVLSTPAEHILEGPSTSVAPESRLSDEQLYLQYEIKRTVEEIRAGRWRRVALQFPDEMLVDAPRVFDRLRADLGTVKSDKRAQKEPALSNVTNGVEHVSLETSSGKAKRIQNDTNNEAQTRLCILGDTSYGACCVDEVAAEHVEADVVVHYGRACLSPTARLPVIHVFTSKLLDVESAVRSFQQTYPDKEVKVCLMADIPYNHHMSSFAERLRREGYTNIFATEIVQDTSSLLPNRTLPYDVQEDPEKLKEYAAFHLSSPPTSLLLILSSRVKGIHIFPTDQPDLKNAAEEASTAQLLRRRYALITRLSTVPIFGILINTLSVSNYMAALQHCQDLIAKAGKKSYVFVVGKVNAAKVANFSEIGGWVVIGCWESSLIESKDFYRPIITPFELEVALTDDKVRVWGSEWVGDFSALLGRERKTITVDKDAGVGADDDTDAKTDGDWDDQPSDDEPPEFDFKTGRYVSHSRPMGKPKITPTLANTASNSTTSAVAPVSSALIQRAKGDVATVNGTVSPAAEFLRSKRTWQGLGSDYEIAYERDDAGRIRGAAMEEGRSGVAKGYRVGEDGVNA